MVAAVSRLALHLQMLRHGTSLLPSKGPRTARVFHFCLAVLPSLRTGLVQASSQLAPARVIARKSACFEIGLLLGSA